MGLLKNLLSSGSKSQTNSVPACPAISDTDNFVRWKLRYGPEFREIRDAFFTQRPDAWVDIGVAHVTRELQKYPDPKALCDRYTEVAAVYEGELLRLVRNRGGVRLCPEELKFTAIEMYSRLIFMNEFLRQRHRFIPPAPFGVVTPLPV